MQLALIRGSTPGLCPLNLLTACAAGGTVDLITVPDNQYPDQADLVIVDDPDPNRSLAYIRTLQSRAPTAAVLMVAQDPDPELLAALLGLHVAAFVPAPVSPQVFQQTFDQLTRDIHQFRQNYVPAGQLTQAQDQIKTLLQERFLLALSTGSIPEDCPNEVLCQTYGLDLHSKSYAAVCISAGPRPDPANIPAHSPRGELPGWIDRWAQARDIQVIWRDTPDLFSAVFCFSKEPPKDIFCQLHRQLQAELGPELVFTLGCSLPRTKIYDLCHALEQARSCVRSRLLRQPGQVIGEHTLNQNTDTGARYWTFQRTLQFRTAVIVGSTELANATLETVFQDLTDHCTDNGVLMGVLGHIPHLVLGGLDPEQHSRLQTYVFTLDFWHLVDSSDNLPELLDQLKRWLQDKIAQHRVERDTSPAITKCLQYIGENISKSLSLQEAASIVGLTPSYLSTLFRQQVGWTFSEYIQSLRISTALHLLQTENMTVAEVAQAAGYKDYRYFTRTFTRTLGLNPSQYRKSQQQG